MKTNACSGIWWEKRYILNDFSDVGECKLLRLFFIVFEIFSICDANEVLEILRCIYSLSFVIVLL